MGYQIELGDGARSFVHELATELAYKQSAGSDEPTDAAIRRATRCIMQRIGCCIMRSNAAIIETGQNKGGAVPGHTAANSVPEWKIPGFHPRRRVAPAGLPAVPRHALGRRRRPEGATSRRSGQWVGNSGDFPLRQLGG